MPSNPLNGRNSTEKLFDLLENQGGYDVRTFTYPEDIESELAGVGHYLVININESTGTKFLNQIAKTVTNAGISNQPVINSSPIATRQQIGSIGNTKRITTTIALYMPENVGSSYGTSWENTDVQGFAAAAQAFRGFNSMADAFNNSDDAFFENQVKQAVDSAYNGKFSAGTLRLLQTGFEETSIGAGLQARYRTLRNPYMEFLFKGINAREFTFEFKLTPRSENEARTIRDIIKMLKFHSAPEVQDNTILGTFYTYPSEFDITFFSNGTRNDYLHKISTCALKDIQINYSGSGMFAAHRDVDGKGSPPTNTTLTLTFQELELMTKERIQDGF